jgi:hypothetical protein
MGDGTKNKSSLNFPSFSFSPNISVRTQHFFHICQECFSGGNINPFSGDLKCHFVFPNIYNIHCYCVQKAITNDFIWCYQFLRNVRTTYKSCHTAQRSTGI